MFSEPNIPLVDSDEFIGESDVAGVELLNNNEEFDAQLKGEVYLGDFSKSVTRPALTRVDFTKRDEVEQSEEELDDCLERARLGLPQLPGESFADLIQKQLEASPEYQRLRKEVVAATSRPLKKSATPCACEEGKIRCGENVARTETTAGGWIIEYDQDGGMLRAYDSRA